MLFFLTVYIDVLVDEREIDGRKQTKVPKSQEGKVFECLDIHLLPCKFLKHVRVLKWHGITCV